MQYLFSHFLVNGQVMRGSPEPNSLTLQMKAGAEVETIFEALNPTALTIAIPENLVEKTPFTVSGKLTYRVGGVDYALPGQVVSLVANSVSLGSVLTGADGAYSFPVTFPSFGTKDLVVSYAGGAMLSAAKTRAQARLQ